MVRAIVAAAALLAALPTHSASYDFTYAGTEVHWLDSWECPALQCTVPLVTLPWIGTLSITAPDGDGTFTLGQVTALLDGARLSQRPLLAPLGITVQGGSVVEFAGFANSLDAPWMHYTFEGMSMSIDVAHQTHYGPTTGEAQLAAVVTHAPEPSTWAMMLAGAMALALRRRRTPNAGPTSRSAGREGCRPRRP